MPTMETKRIDQSPMNPQRWCITLSCGHEIWVTCAREPKRKKYPCPACKDKKPADPGN